VNEEDIEEGIIEVIKHQLLKQRPIAYTYTYSLVSNIIVMNHIFIGTKAFCNFGCVVLNYVLDIINFFFQILYV
jgi:hypothetical protein